MRFAIYLPPQVESGQKVPLLFWLSGLTCTDENFMQKAGALRVAAHLGMAIIAPDTSPRGEAVPDDPDGAYDLGLGAGFYLNATQAPWDRYYQMYDYITKELPPIITSHFPVLERYAISGHSMGGHGALTLGLRNPQLFYSISALSPICNPSVCPWGQKAFTAYLGPNKSAWRDYDAVEIIKTLQELPPLLIDQGDQDAFLESQLHTQTLITLASNRGFTPRVRLQAGYDHSFYFVSSFIEDHLRFHSENLCR